LIRELDINIFDQYPGKPKLRRTTISHVASVELEIKDFECLKAACKTLGLIFHEGKKNYKWYGRWMNDYNGTDAAFKQGFNPKTYGKDAEHVISVANNTNAYEIGVVKNPTTGKYHLVYDFWCQGNGLEKVVGKSCDNLCKQYAKEVAVKQVKRLGYTAQVTTNASGEIEITATKY
jgi:hypothetical protein